MKEEVHNEDWLQTIMRSDVVVTRCNTCGTEQIMNAAYSKYVTNGIKSCGTCRNKETR
jgi:hypothetical protein